MQMLASGAGRAPVCVVMFVMYVCNPLYIAPQMRSPTRHILELFFKVLLTS